MQTGGLVGLTTRGAVREQECLGPQGTTCTQHVDQARLCCVRPAGPVIFVMGACVPLQMQCSMMPTPCLDQMQGSDTACLGVTWTAK